jgi:hypothetical protein
MDILRENNLKKDLVVGKKLYWYTYLLGFVAAFIPSFLNYEIRFTVVFVLYVVLLYLTYLVFWRGLKALGTLFDAPGMDLVAKANLYGGVVISLLTLLSIWLFENQSLTDINQLTSEQVLLNSIIVLVFVPISYYGGKGMGSLPSNIFGNLPKSIQKYYYILAIGSALNFVGTLLGGAFLIIGMIGAFLMVALFPAIIDGYKIYKLAVLKNEQGGA